MTELSVGSSVSFISLVLTWCSSRERLCARVKKIMTNASVGSKYNRGLREGSRFAFSLNVALFFFFYSFVNLSHFARTRKDGLRSQVKGQSVYL